MKKPLVSVIIPTKNSASTIAKCLESVRNQRYKNIETILVDASSSDGTVETAKRFSAKVIESKAQRSEARNIGAKAAHGRFLFFIDSDMELSPDVVSDCILASGKADAVIIPERSVGKGFWSHCKALEKRCYDGDDSVEAPRFFKRTAYMHVGGYDENLVACEDWDLGQRIRASGSTIGRVRSVIYHHERSDFWSMVHSKYFYGKTALSYVKKHGGISHSIFRGAFVRNWKMLVANPHHAAGMLLLKCCEFAAAGLGALVSIGHGGDDDNG